jgi:shikimate dehydrogenase
MHRSALNCCALEGEYLALEVNPEHLPLAMAELKHAGYRGLNVTTPHKISVIEFLVGLSDEAKAIGSVNTLIQADGGFYGENTDARGFHGAYLADLKDPGLTRALVLGSGGASRAVIVALRRAGIEPWLSARDPYKAGALGREFGLRVLAWDGLAGGGPFDLLVNATSCSSAADFSPTPPEINLAQGARVIDINYGRVSNLFEDLAAKSGGDFRDGLAMLAHQARLSFWHWTSQDPGLGPFQASLENYLRESRKSGH